VVNLIKTNLEASLLIDTIKNPAISASAIRGHSRRNAHKMFIRSR